MPTFYLDYENGNDTNDGSDWANAWKTITLGATAARIAPGDIIKIAKSPAPTALAGTTATWTNLSKTVTLNTAETANIEMCEADWTAVNATSSAKIGTDWKEGTYALKMVEDATPTNDEVQCYSDLYTHDTTVHNLSGYQKISFWIKNEVAILANQLEINLCSNADGTGDVDTFAIPEIPSTGRWVPLTIARTGGGNLGNAIKSINISNGSNTTEYTASKYIYVDNIIACTTDGLNLQSLISKNSAEQGGAEGWYGIQSINETIVLLDNETNTLANAGNGYSTVGTSPETVNTYKRETIKTSLVAGASTPIQEIKDNGYYGSNIEFQGGYDTATGNQTGETFFDGLTGRGYGLQISSLSYITLNHLNFTRYNYGIFYNSSNNINILTIFGSNNTGSIMYFNSSRNNIINKIVTINNGLYGILFENNSNNNIITDIFTANNIGSGVYFTSSSDNIINKLSSYQNNYGVSFLSTNNLIIEILTANNIGSSLYSNYNNNYIYKATLTETNKVIGIGDFANSKTFITKLNGNYSAIYTDGGNIVSQASTLTAGSGTEWKLTTETNVNRQLNYPLKLSIAKIAVVANKEVTVTCYFKKGHATNIGAQLVFPAQLGEVLHSATCPDDTNENNLSIAFTPTEAGVIEIEAWAYYIAGHSTVIIDAMTITQAA